MKNVGASTPWNYSTRCCTTFDWDMAATRAITTATNRATNHSVMGLTHRVPSRPCRIGVNFFGNLVELPFALSRLASHCRIREWHPTAAIMSRSNPRRRNECSNDTGGLTMGCKRDENGINSFAPCWHCWSFFFCAESIYFITILVEFCLPMVLSAPVTSEICAHSKGNAVPHCDWLGRLTALRLAR